MFSRSVLSCRGGRVCAVGLESPTFNHSLPLSGAAYRPSSYVGFLDLRFIFNACRRAREPEAVEIRSPQIPNSPADFYHPTRHETPAAAGTDDGSSKKEKAAQRLLALLMENESEAERAAKETAAYRAHPYLRRQWVAAPEIFDDAIEYRKSAEEHTDAFQRGVDVNAVILSIEGDKKKAENAHKIEGKPGERPILGSIHRKTAIRFGGVLSMCRSCGRLCFPNPKSEIYVQLVNDDRYVLDAVPDYGSGEVLHKPSALMRQVLQDMRSAVCTLYVSVATLIHYPERDFRVWWLRRRSSGHLPATALWCAC